MSRISGTRAVTRRGFRPGVRLLRLTCRATDRPPPPPLTQSCPTAGQLINPLETLSEVPYDKRREYDAEHTVPFCALRLCVSGLIKANPKKIITEKTD
jgi:hypothetical protein